ncbi:uncharacterized protein LOC117144754, partial [Drosophila mauritiana]|uniref:Uncharacterized protein LOC117144754 n=1 Tax=Drosophila mauritiana TaxID=7226 RepID=A0A6P8KQ10_DROMA
QFEWLLNMKIHLSAFVAVTLLLLSEITHPLETLDDFEVAEEITTPRENGDIERIEGRTRQMSVLSFVGKNRTGKMNENYCCFWIYQDHPPIPHTWKHMAEYPFDFQFNGEFVRNQRHNAVEVPAVQDGDSDNSTSVI